MKRFFIFITVLSLIGIGGVKAQDYTKALDNFHQEYLRRQVSGELDPSIQGSPFLDDVFQEATIFMKGTEPVNTGIRIDCYNNAFQIKKGDQILELTTDRLDSLIYKGIPYIMYNHNGKVVPVAVLRKLGNNALYLHYVIEFQDEVVPKGYQDPSPAQYIEQDPEYIFLLEGKDPITLARLSKFPDNFPERKDEIKKFIKKNKIKKNKEGKLILLFEYIAEL